MFRFEGITKGTQLGPYRYHNDGIIYFGQWRVPSILFRMEHLMGKVSYTSQMDRCLKEGLLMAKVLAKAD
jgi:hypothetical protein